MCLINFFTSRRRDFIWCWITTTILWIIGYYSIYSSQTLGNGLEHSVGIIILSMVGSISFAVGLFMMILGLNVLIKGGWKT